MGKKSRREFSVAQQEQQAAPKQEAINRHRYDNRIPGHYGQSDWDRVNTPLQKQGWYRIKGREGVGWKRTTKDGEEIFLYLDRPPDDTLAEKWGRDLAQMTLPRSFAEQVAGDFNNELFRRLFLRGFDSIKGRLIDAQ